MSRKKLRKALKDPNTVHQVRLRDGRVVEWTGNDDSRHCCIWPKGAAAGSRVEPFPVQTAVGSAQSNQSWHHRWRLGALVEVAGLSDRQMQQCQLDQPVGRFATGELRCPPLVLEPLAPE
ncbi:MAG: hypothetical protein K0S98_3037 [Propionibacteriaceae bacterium]|jgi:hypothetical protein|nr:hypothetical protein [Propionibacteriaceae bacterium]